MTAASLWLVAFAAIAQTAPEQCAKCHRAQTADFAQAGMTRALMRAGESPVLKAHPTLRAILGAYRYELITNESRAVLRVADESGSLEVPLEWAFGEGSVGQTYLFRREGQWYESRVSYFATLPGLDLTLGQQAFTPANLLEAAGRRTSTSEAERCFGCHATGTAASRAEGVLCARCHGPEARHPNPALRTMSTEEQSDFCGECHRTWAEVAASGPHGIQNIRFQPYRLAGSKCYDATDARIQCTACHDPHRPLATATAAYDSKCTACHGASSAHICRVATKDCVTCHMPRLELPGAHRAFADHRIRIVKPGEAYPE